MKLKIISILLFVFVVLVYGSRGRYENADYSINGELTPDATGNYFKAGEYGGKSYYRRSDGAWFIWWQVSDWYISDALGGGVEPKRWIRNDSNIVGDYEPRAGAVGTAAVSIVIGSDYRSRYSY